MIFASNIFIFAFLPIFLGAYYLTPVKFRSLIIILGSYAFYAWWRIDFTFLFAAVTLWNYLIYLQIRKERFAKRWMLLGVGGNLAVLGFFKYAGFGVDSLNQALGLMDAQPLSFIDIILPIGISFYIFQAISFLIDVYRKDAPHPKNFIDFCAYLSLFPQLIAGPILRYKDMAHQFYQRTHTLDKFSEGAYRFMLGLAQKILIADSIAPLADAAFALENPTMFESWLGVLAFSAQLYFDFLGYSSMAIGLGLMMGFRFIENFDHPYLSRSITEFWRRWHISLSSWLKDYLYIPLGGNRKGQGYTYSNLMITMVLGGLWHGANITFALWGVWHGLLLAIERKLGVKSQKTRHWLYILPTLFFVTLGWVLFRAETLTQAISFYAGMFGSHGFLLSDYMNWQISYFSLTTFIIAWILIFVTPKFLDTREKIGGSVFMHTLGYKNIYFASSAVFLFILSLIKLSASSHSPFLYFQF